MKYQNLRDKVKILHVSREKKSVAPKRLGSGWHLLHRWKTEQDVEITSTKENPAPVGSEPSLSAKKALAGLSGLARFQKIGRRNKKLPPMFSFQETSEELFLQTWSSSKKEDVKSGIGTRVRTLSRVGARTGAAGAGLQQGAPGRDRTLPRAWR